MTYLHEVTVGGNVVEYADNFREAAEAYAKFNRGGYACVRVWKTFGEYREDVTLKAVVYVGLRSDGRLQPTMETDR